MSSGERKGMKGDGEREGVGVRGERVRERECRD